jgi:hypothetical protein
MSGLKPGAEEYLRARAEAHTAARKRAQLRKAMIEQPEIRAAWVRLAHDRFTALPANCDLIVETIGKGHIRGMVPKSVEDRATGDLLRITYGDIGDHVMRGSLRVGRDGVPIPLMIRTLEEESQSLFIVNAWRVMDNNIGSQGKSKSFPFPGDRAMNVLARLFNCGDGRFVFVGMRGPPHILDRPKERYGPDKIEQYARDRDAFIDRYVDHYYASLGLDPKTGRLDPESIPKPT